MTDEDVIKFREAVNKLYPDNLKTGYILTTDTECVYREYPPNWGWLSWTGQCWAFCSGGDVHGTGLTAEEAVLDELTKRKKKENSGKA